MKVIFRTLDGLEAIKEVHNIWEGKFPERIKLILPEKKDTYGTQYREYILTQEGHGNFVYVEKA